ncbi:excinuclease ABC subunit UvrC [Prosthecobacter sp. SYSU 5D2]|uniref:excinuclease ABC subunit UvrC n=1 Tax=Prosthecobacter sp. SYSU 5D2 TaxID=3134134 RepID=UPI0031FE50EC
MPDPRSKPDLMAKLRDVPHTPGVYVMRDRLNSVIYVGKARDLRKRLSNYFTPARSKLVDRKTRALIASIWDFDIHEVRNEPESLLLEGKLIKEFRPKYNISFRDDKRFLMVRVNLQDDFPKFTLTRMKRDDGARYFGPFAHSGALRTTLNWLNKKFGLRVCKPIRPDELTYKHCSNDIIKNCSAPCIGRVTIEEYRQRMEQACSFLDGKGTKDLVALLEEEMQKAAMKLDFEKAAELRDMVEDLRKTLSPTRSFQRGSRIRVMSTLDPMADVKELQDALGLGKPPLVMECFDIANIGTAHCVASMVRFKDGVPDNSNYRRYRIRAVTGQNDFISMAEVIRRRFSRILLEGREVMGAEEADFSQETPLEMMRRLEQVVELEGDAVAETDAVNEMPPAAKASVTKDKKTKFIRLPDLVIVDGGKGQLGMAMKELHRLGLADLPIIGLAKEREEIYRPHEPDPLVLPHETGALKLLQRIRDEAHRWANGYHQLLLGKRVEESLLDDCPGVSQARKATLLKKFGSVARLRKATAAEVATVPGISTTLAETIMDFLKSREG